MRFSPCMFGLFFALGCHSPEALFAVKVKVSTYNVAGLPAGLSSSKPEVNTALIAPKLSIWDLVAVQEDFAFHHVLISDPTHPYITSPEDWGGGNGALGDGLSLFSNYEIKQTERFDWNMCNGTTMGFADCLTKKGYQWSVLRIPHVGLVHLYNVHFDAGSDALDLAARQSQVTQLKETLLQNSQDVPLIVMGDTNMEEWPSESYMRFISEMQLRDACVEILCPVLTRIDRIFVRSSSKTEVRVNSWKIRDDFHDETGEPLSDHDPIEAELEFIPILMESMK